MKAWQGVRQISLKRAAPLPRKWPPAGYVILIQDVAYGNRYKIARHQQLDRHQIKRGDTFPFETRVALILEADDAPQAERDLHDEYAADAAFGDWFDLDRFPEAPTLESKPPRPPGRPETVSLRDLMENGEGADSLLQDSPVVDAAPRESQPRRPARSRQPREGRRRQSEAQPGRPQPSIQRRQPRRMRWAFVAVALTLAGLLVAERAGDIERVIASLIDEATKQASVHRSTAAPTNDTSARTRRSSPTPKPAGEGEVFYTKTRARVRTCANTDCRAVEALDVGAEIKARRIVSGENVNGSTRWIAFYRQGELRYVHGSLLSPSQPAAEPTRIRLAKPELLLAERRERSLKFNWHKMTEAESYQYRYSVNDEALSNWKTSSRFSQTLDGLSPGDRVRFLLRARRNGVHSPVAELSAQTLPAPTATVEPPTATDEPSPTPQPPTATASDTPVPHATATDEPSSTPQPPSATASDTPVPPATATDEPSSTPQPPSAASTQAPASASAAVASSAKHVVLTAGGANAHVRACPSTSCDIVAKFASGAAVDVLGPVAGETVYGIDVWLEIELDGGGAYIHSSLVAANQ